MPDVQDPVKIVNEAFNTLKETVNENEKRRDGLLEEKMNKVNATLDKFEAANSALTTLQQTQKAQQEALDKVEQMLNRGSLGGGNKNDEARATATKAFDRLLRTPESARKPEDLKAVNDYCAALVKSDDSGSGYLVAMPEMVKEIIKDVIEQNPMRALATVRTIGGHSLKMPRRTSTAGAATRIGEKGTRANTGDPAYGMLEFLAPEMYARAEISVQMLEDSDYDLVGELREEFSEQFALKEGTEFLSGTGVNNQAEGLLVNGDVGFEVSGDANLITADGLITVFYGVKTAYSRNGVFILNRKSIGAIRKLKGSDGHFLWAPGIPGAAPNTILGASYVEMPSMPDIAAGTYPVAFGDFRKAYTIVDRVAMSFQSDFTTGADDGLVVYRARKRVGGGVRQAEAVRKLKISV